MPSRAYTSLLLTKTGNMYLWYILGVNALTGLYLIATKYRFFYDIEDNYGVNALTGLYLIATMDAAECTYPLEKVSMPSRAYTSLLP